MPITIDATPGGLSSNSYLTIARSNALAETLPHMVEWLTHTDIDKAQLITHATRMIDLYFAPNGRKTNRDQALWWPQDGLCYYRTTVDIPGSIIPQFLEYATVEWAWALHENPDPYSSVDDGLKLVDSPSYRLEFTGSREPVIPRMVSILLGPYTARHATPFVRLTRV